MIVLNHKQGTDEWLAARAGIPTASCFDQIITPKTRKPSGSQDRYLARLLAERWLGRPLDEAKSGFMDRGTELEPEARARYAFDFDCDPVEVGLCLTDDGRVGASPDALVGEDGLLEIKCCGPAEQMGRWLAGGTDDHVCQTQGQLWVTGRAWVDLYSWHPSLPIVRQRIVRDEAFIADLAKAVNGFADALEAAWARLEPLRAEQTARDEADLPAELTA